MVKYEITQTETEIYPTNNSRLRHSYTVVMRAQQSGEQRVAFPSLGTATRGLGHLCHGFGLGSRTATALFTGGYYAPFSGL